MRRFAILPLAFAVVLAGCGKRKQSFSDHVEVLQVRTFGGSCGQGKLTDLELRFSECPGNARQVLRAPREFSACGTRLRPATS